MSATSIGEIHRVQLSQIPVQTVQAGQAGQTVLLAQPVKSPQKHGWLYYTGIAAAVLLVLAFVGWLIYTQGFKCGDKHLNGYCSGTSNSCLRGKCAKKCKVDSDCVIGKDGTGTNGSCVDKHCAPPSAQSCDTITDCGSGEICALLTSTNATGTTTGGLCVPGVNRGPYLVENQTLRLGEYLQSANGVYTASPDFKGRFHIVGGKDSGTANADTPKVDFYWPDATARTTSRLWFVTLQNDGNFVLSDGTNKMTSRDVAFAPGSADHFVAKLSDNGKFNVYVGTLTKLGDIVPAARPFN